MGDEDVREVQEGTGMMDSFEVIISVVVELSEAVLLRYLSAHCETGPEHFTDRVSICAVVMRVKKKVNST